MAASSIPAARTWLVAGLTASSDLAGVLVVRTGSLSETPDLERIDVRNARSIVREWRTLDGTLTESYIIPVSVLVVQHGQELQPVEDRLWEIVTGIEKVVRRNSTFDGLLISALPAGAPDGENSGGAENADVAASLTLEVSCQALLRP